MPPVPEKRQTAEEVQWENRVAYQKGEHDRLVKAKETLQSEIDRKTSDYSIYVSQKDAESKKIRQDALDSQEQLAKDKQEFQGILQDFQKQKAEFSEAQKGKDNDRAKVEAQMNNIREFVIAVQRACSLLGL